MVVTAPRMTVSGAAPATPKNTTDGTPSRLRASARDTMSGPAGSGRAINGLQAWMLALRRPSGAGSGARGDSPAAGREHGSDGRLGVVDELSQVGREGLHDGRAGG